MMFRKKITDRMRLNFLDKLAREGTPGGWFSVNFSDGSVCRIDAGENRMDWDNPRSTIRAAIDALMRQEPL